MNSDWGIFFILALVVVIIYLGNKKKRSKKYKVPKPDFPYLILDEGEVAPENKWFQKVNWKNKAFISYKENWGPDWKYASPIPGESNVKIAGISRGNKSADFLKMAQLDDFKIFLEHEPANPVNTNARKAMITATVDGKPVTKNIGYLPDEIANEFAGVELNISPNSVFLPPDENHNLGVKVTLLKRSAHYLKRKAKEQ